MLYRADRLGMYRVFGRAPHFASWRPTVATEAIAGQSLKVGDSPKGRRKTDLSSLAVRKELGINSQSRCYTDALYA